MKHEIEFNSHRSLTMMLVLMILANPFIYQHNELAWVARVIFVFILLASVRTIAGQPYHFWPLIVLAVLSLVGQFGLLLFDNDVLQGLRHVASALFIFWISALLLRDVIVRSTEVTQDLILGAVNIYILIGLAFAFVYAYMNYLDPATFSGLDDTMQQVDSILPFVSYSFVTMTTLGYGNVVPLTPYANTLAWVQAVFGQLYLAILVARLVGLYIARKQ